MSYIFDIKLDKENVTHYVIQSTMATVALFIAISLPYMDEPILIAAIGSTSFIVFAMPESRTANPKNVLGGHLLCGILGLLFFKLHSTLLPLTATIALAVGASIFLMVVLDIEHPPAGGTVIFLILNPMVGSLIALLLSASIISTIATILHPYLIDLV
ncbi:MAG: HPP family protein, partial [Thermoplasmatota archaeon]